MANGLTLGGNLSVSGTTTLESNVTVNGTLTLKAALGSATQPIYVNASKQLAACNPAPKSGDWFSGGFAVVGTDGVMEIGRYIDFHATDAATADYSVRIDATADAAGNTLYLPKVTGQLVTHTNDTAVGTQRRPVYIDAEGQATAMTLTASTSKCYVAGVTSASSGFYYNTSVYTEGTVLMGAAWNDYAEFRKANTIEPGRVVIEDVSGEMKLSTERMQPGANIISDTYGFTIGQTEECKTPIAVAGRVLAYTFEDRNSYPLGAAVCSGPNGTVSLMTREEIREYPERIIGTVSEIPNYETWGADNIKVNNRIWIKI